MIVKIIQKVKTLQNREIQLYKAESLSANVNKTVFIIGVFHGDEPEGEPLILKLMEDIKKNPDIIGENRILFIPVLNPDGKAQNIRVNSKGVDLNRNFPTNNWILSREKDLYYSGDNPASEIETCFVIDILDKYKPDIIFTLHKPYRIVNFDGPALDIAKKISELNGYPVQDDIGYPTPGSFGTYAGIEKGIPVITLEMPDNSDFDTLWKENSKVFYFLCKF